MNRLVLLLSLFIMCCFVSGLSAQIEDDDADLNLVSRTSTVEKNAITIDFFPFYWKTYAIQYERYLTNWLSVEFGGGISYGTGDAEYLLGRKIIGPSAGFNLDYGIRYYERSPKIGKYLSCSLRYFFDEDAMCGWAVGPLVRYSVKRAEVPDVEGEYISPLNEYLPESRNNLDFCVMVSNQYVNPGAMGAFVAIGVEISRHEYHQLVENLNAIQPMDKYIQEKRSTVTKIPILLVGTKIGFSF